MRTRVLMPMRERTAAAPPAASRAGELTGTSFVDRESARKPSWAKTSPSADSLIRPSSPKPARTARSPAATPPADVTDGK